MGLLSLILALLAHAAVEPDWRRSDVDFPELLEVLASVPEGQRLLEEVSEKDPIFQKKLLMGEASLTESTFSRSYSLVDGQEKIQVRHEITLNRRLRMSEAVVDLAHELVHFSKKEMLDPYREGFELKQFVLRGIEGPGGELEALSAECGIAWALEKRYKNFPKHPLCAPYKNQNGAFNLEQARLDYYAVGRWLERAGELRKIFPDLHSGKVIFTSSYARKPYPIALAEEYDAIRKTACENNRRKYKLIAAQAMANERRPASVSPLVRERERLKSYEKLYCQQ
jgi:hypothetical protein